MLTHHFLSCSTEICCELRMSRNLQILDFSDFQPLLTTIVTIKQPHLHPCYAV